MPYIPKSLRTPLRLVYSRPDRSEDGMLTELPGKLATALTFDHFGLSHLPSSKKVTLWFRSGLKRVFHVQLIRRGGRFLVEMGGGDPKQVLRCVQICKTHFDEVFGITSDDIRLHRTQKPAKGSENGKHRSKRNRPSNAHGASC